MLPNCEQQFGFVGCAAGLECQTGEAQWMPGVCEAVPAALESKPLGQKGAKCCSSVVRLWLENCESPLTILLSDKLYPRL